jgi:serine/threonine-protein kinase
MVADCVSKNESFLAGKPRVWSDYQLRDVATVPNYELAPDGKRFAVIPNSTAATEEKGDVHMTFLLNFFDELRRRVPVDRK